MRGCTILDQFLLTAVKATVFKAHLQIADMDRHYYGDHSLTVARHPSETDERMMVRLLAFALYVDDALVIANGMGATKSPICGRRTLPDRSNAG